jgi:alpha-mannosidase
MLEAKSPDIALLTAQLRQLTQIDIQSSWHYCQEPLDIQTVKLPEFWSTCQQWPIAHLNKKGHIAWSANREIIWLTQKIIIPPDLNGYPLSGFSLRLALLWWAEDAQLFVNGQLVQQGDLFDCNMRILLDRAVSPGAEIYLALRLVSPGHDPGALVRSRLIYEPADSTEIDPGFFADELTILFDYINKSTTAGFKFINHRQNLYVEAIRESPLQEGAIEPIETFNRQINSIDWSVVHDREAFNQSLSVIRENLRSLLSRLPNIPDNIPNQISLLGHAHLDMAWLWPIPDTWLAAQRTFESVLNLMSDFPELTFCHSTAALYEWIETNRPDLFAAIQQQVKAGRWEIVAGLWVEPELNIISGESIARQLLYGQRYCLEKFGQLAPVAWLPDSFGFCWQIPQLFTQAGIEYFVTQKLRWNDTTEFPYGVFWWESPDGSRIFSLMSAAIGKDINPVEMAEYSSDWQQQTGLNHALWLPGVGDHGGGPTRDMLEVAKKWQQSPFIPQLEYNTSEQYLQKIKQVAENLSDHDLPIWRDELYLEYHRGCYTTYAKQKQWNRRCENLLYAAELYSTLANIIGDVPYPKQELETAWKQVLFNQFHDILPGSSIPEVYQDANPAWQQAQTVAKERLEMALSAIAQQISLPNPPTPDAQPIVIFNSLNWSRSEVVEVNLPDIESGKCWQVYNQSGEKVRSNKTFIPLTPPFLRGAGGGSQISENCLLFYAEDIPSIGYRLFWLVPEKAETIASQPSTENYILENQLLRVVVDPETGNLSSMSDKVNQREVLSDAGNQLQAFQDSGQYWDAWNIDPNYGQHPLPAPTLKHIQWLETGPIQWKIRVDRQIGRSHFIQDYILDSHSPILKINTLVDWQEPHVMVKAAFPLNVESEMAAYEMPCGTIERTTKPQTPAEKAKWEVPALRWADLTEHSQNNSQNTSYGVSVLNDCKYAYDAQPNQLRLTLLRGSTWPDPAADFYQHEFTYAIYPHRGSWQSAQTVQRGYELNVPLSVIFVNQSAPLNLQASQKTLPVHGSFLELSAENLILMAFKPTEDESETQKWILRCYEAYGQATEIHLHSDLGLKLDGQVDLLEEPITTDSRNISPWKVTSYRIVPE